MNGRECVFERNFMFYYENVEKIRGVCVVFVWVYVVFVSFVEENLSYLCFVRVLGFEGLLLLDLDIYFLKSERG